MAAIYLGLFPSALGFVLWGYTVGHLPIATSTSLLYLVPPVAVLIAWILIDEIPSGIELTGGLIVIAGVVIVAHGNAIRQRWHRDPARRTTRPRPGNSAGSTPDNTAGRSGPPKPRTT